MKLADIYEMTFINLQTEIDNKPLPKEEEPQQHDKMSRSRRIARAARMKARDANPGDGDTVSGWRSTPAASPVNNMSASAI